MNRKSSIKDWKVQIAYAALKSRAFIGRYRGVHTTELEYYPLEPFYVSNCIIDPTISASLLAAN